MYTIHTMPHFQNQISLEVGAIGRNCFHQYIAEAIRIVVLKDYRRVTIELNTDLAINYLPEKHVIFRNKVVKMVQ